MKYTVSLFFALTTLAVVNAQTDNLSKHNLRAAWLQFQTETYTSVKDTDRPNTIYLKVPSKQMAGSQLTIQSSRPYFLFWNGKLTGEFTGRTEFKMDSLSAIAIGSEMLLTIYQTAINSRDLKTFITTAEPPKNVQAPVEKPRTFFKDFVIMAGLLIIIAFMVITRINPKLAADYLSVVRIFSQREGDDVQANARLTSSANIQFYFWSSFLLGFCLMIIFYHLPDEYSLPLQFKGESFGGVIWQWIRLSLIIVAAFLLKVVLLFSATRLFGMDGLARIHFFNWVRVMLVIFGALSIILFVYFVSHGRNALVFSTFFTVVIVVLTAWIIIVYQKLNGRTEHSMFHLFSYICATELIPLLITIKVLFQ